MSAKRAWVMVVWCSLLTVWDGYGFATSHGLLHWALVPLAVAVLACSWTHVAVLRDIARREGVDQTVEYIRQCMKRVP